VTRVLATLLLLLGQGVVLAQEEGVAGPSRLVEEEPPAAIPPVGDDDATRAVMGADNDKKPRRAPPARVAKPTAKVHRDQDGKVVLPKAPEPLMDPLAPRRTGMTGVDRAELAARQVLSGVLFGLPAFALGACAFVPLVLVSSVNPLFGLAAMGAFFAVIAPMQGVAAILGLFLPAYLNDVDYGATAAAAATVLVVDALAVVLGGVTATVVWLRWAPAPSNAIIRTRGPFTLEVVRQMDGTTWAMVLNVIAATSLVVFVGPLLGVAAYNLVALARGEPEASPPAPDEPRPPAPTTPNTRRRRVRRTS